MLCVSGFELYSRWVPLKFLENDPLASDHYKKAHTSKFIAAIYMFTKVLPIVT